MCGAICAASALGGFAWGFFMGKRVGGSAAKAEAGPTAREESQAFARMMSYSADDAYGREGVSER